MKVGDAKARSKVVVRKLPPSLSRSDFFGKIDPVFAGRYIWTSFRPGIVSSQKGQRCSRAYICFKRPEDVLDFAEFFDGHMFVNEKGTYFKAMVEYAPCQRVPRPSPNDGREGTIYIDPDYLEFLKFIAKPVDNLRKPAPLLEATEQEQTGDIPVVTPLMEFVRQKRSIGNGVQDATTVVKANRTTYGASKDKLASVNIEHERDKKKNGLNDKTKGASRRDNSENDIRTPKTENKKIRLLRGKELKVPEGEIASEQSHQHQNVHKLIRTILLNNEAHQSSPKFPPKNIKPKILDREKQVHRPTDLKSGVTCRVSKNTVGSVNFDYYVKSAADHRLSRKELHVPDNIHENSAKHEKGLKSKRTGENPSRGQNSFPPENGPKRYFSQHHSLGVDAKKNYMRKDNDFWNKMNTKPSKRSAEKQVWVQKSSSELGK